jgi:hypothetical protein
MWGKESEKWNNFVIRKKKRDKKGENKKGM